MTSNEISDRLSKCFSSVIHDVMRDEGYKNFVSMAIATETGGTPCGSCRQVIWELCGNIPIYICDKNGVINETTSSALLPKPFETKDLK